MILVINSGSSSLKFSVFTPDVTYVVAQGVAERLGSEKASLSYKVNIDANGDLSSTEKFTQALGLAAHKEALDAILSNLSPSIKSSEITAIGHRVVHGGESFSHSTVVDEHVIEKIKECVPLAPLHNPANLESIEILREKLPQTPQIAVFDTAFHQTLPKKSYLYALPYTLYKQHGVRRYGFHGISHQYVSNKCIEQYELSENDHSIIVAHLGNGCSLSAVKNRISVDTTMGMTPLEGLVMGTRSGDVDPGLHEYLSKKLNIDINGITEILNRKSGLLGISGLSNDMRELVEANEKGHTLAALALEVFCYKVAKSIAALMVSLGRLDALVFTAGVGENSSYVRKNVVDQLGFLGLVLDDSANEKNGAQSNGVITNLSDKASKPLAAVIPTDEEKMIAQECLAFA